MHNLGIQMNRKELIKPFITNSSWKSPFGLHDLYKINSEL